MIVISLQVWCPLLGNNINQGISNVTLTSPGSTMSIVNTGKLGKTYDNSSKTAGGFRTSDVVDLGSAQSMFCWFRFVSLSDNSALGCGIISQHRYPKNTGLGITVKYVSSTTGYLSANTGTGSSRTYNTYCGSTLLQANTWYHVGITYDGTNVLKLYVNGVCDGTHNVGQMSTPADYLMLYCWSLSSSSGATVHNNYVLNGAINDARVYDECLSPKEVEILARGLVLHYPLSLSGANIAPGSYAEERSYSYPSGSSLTDRWASTTSIVPSASQYVLSFWAKSTHSGDKIRAHYYSPNTTTRCETNQGTVTTASDGNIEITLSDKWEKYWIIYTQSSTTAVKHLILPRMAGPDSTHTCKGTGTVSIKLVKFEESTIPTPWIPCSTDAGYSTMGLNDTIEYDVSGYKYNGEKLGTITYDSDSPRYSSCIVFNGTDSAINCGNDYHVQGAQNMTISLWAYLPDWTTETTQPFISCQESGGFIISRMSGTTIRGRFDRYTASDLSTRAYAQADYVCELTGWHMITATYDTSAIKLYLDGVLVKTSSSTTYGIHFTSNVNTYIGAEATTNKRCIAPFIGGKVSDVRIYYTTLTPTQIAELYNTAISISNNGTLLGYELVEN